MFTIREISELAVQIEVNGEAVYREVASKVSDSALREMLEGMAHDEHQHAGWFKRLGADQLASVQEADEALEAMGRALLAEMLGTQTFSLSAEELGDAGSLAEVIAQAEEFEKDTIVFYEMLADFVADTEVASQLRDIIAEEYVHIDRLNGYLAG
ncbi:MAG: ferritin family protein [Desulfosarcinaceae bacterium]|nr:ferritin family protein [Desulfosarcinaceae bacterium]